VIIQVPESKCIPCPLLIPSIAPLGSWYTWVLFADRVFNGISSLISAAVNISSAADPATGISSRGKTEIKDSTGKYPLIIHAIIFAELKLTCQYPRHC
jgi:hypothetical protein